MNNSTAAEIELPDYITVKDGNGYDHKVINFDNPKYAPFEGMVVLEPTKYSKGLPNQNGIPAYRHRAEVKLTLVTDRQSGMLIGIHNGNHPKTKELRFVPIVVKDVEFFNLANPTERRRYIVIKHGPFVVGSPNFMASSRTQYKIVDKEKESNDYFAERKLKKSASEIADSLWGEKLENMAIALGYDPKLMSPTQLHMEVCKYAESDQKINGKTGAQRFMEVMNSDMEELVILKRGLSAGIVEQIGIEYRFGGIPIGMSELEAIQYLKTHPTTTISIDTQSRGKQTTSHVTAEPKQAVIPDQYAARIANLERELAEAKKRVKDVSEVALEQTSLNTIAEENPEYAELLEEAKNLKVKGAHMIGRGRPIAERIQLLKDKIEDTKKLKNN